MQRQDISCLYSGSTPKCKRFFFSLPAAATRPPAHPLTLGAHLQRVCFSKSLGGGLGVF